MCKDEDVTTSRLIMTMLPAGQSIKGNHKYARAAALEDVKIGDQDD